MNIEVFKKHPTAYSPTADQRKNRDLAAIDVLGLRSILQAKEIPMLTLCEHNIHYVKVFGGVEIVWCALCGKHKWTRSLNGAPVLGGVK